MRARIAGVLFVAAALLGVHTAAQNSGAAGGVRLRMLEAERSAFGRALKKGVKIVAGTERAASLVTQKKADRMVRLP